MAFWDACIYFRTKNSEMYLLSNKRNTEELIVCYNYLIAAGIQHCIQIKQVSTFLLNCTVHIGVFQCPHYPMNLYVRTFSRVNIPSAS